MFDYKECNNCQVKQFRDESLRTFSLQVYIVTLVFIFGIIAIGVWYVKVW